MFPPLDGSGAAYVAGAISEGWRLAGQVSPAITATGLVLGAGHVVEPDTEPGVNVEEVVEEEEVEVQGFVPGERSAWPRGTGAEAAEAQVLTPEPVAEGSEQACGGPRPAVWGDGVLP